MSKSQKDFTVINKLGEGAYSQVYKVKRLSDNQIYALKKVSLDPLSQKERENALNEVRILASIQHPNVVGYKEAFLEEQEKYLCIIMEYADDGDLYQKIIEHQRNSTLFDEDTIWRYFIHMVRGLKALHKLKIFHRDMKSANIFINKNGTAKLGDLNVSKVAKKGLLYTQTGTPYYASPEVWQDQPYDQKSDMWSLGCVLYEIATLQPPFKANDMDGLFKKVLKGSYPQIPEQYSSDLAKIIKKLICVHASGRPSCDQILNNPVVKKWCTKLGISSETDEIENEQQIVVSDGLGGNLALLSTIVLPNNLKLLTDRLPKSKYDDDSRMTKSFKNIIREETSPSSPTDVEDNSRKYRPRIEKSQNPQIKKKKNPLIDLDNQNQASSRRSAISQDRKPLKRNASETLRINIQQSDPSNQHSTPLVISKSPNKQSNPSNQSYDTKQSNSVNYSSQQSSVPNNSNQNNNNSHVNLQIIPQAQYLPERNLRDKSQMNYLETIRENEKPILPLPSSHIKILEKRSKKQQNQLQQSQQQRKINRISSQESVMTSSPQNEQQYNGSQNIFENSDSAPNLMISPQKKQINNQKHLYIEEQNLSSQTQLQPVQQLSSSKNNNLLQSNINNTSQVSVSQSQQNSIQPNNHSHINSGTSRNLISIADNKANADLNPRNANNNSTSGVSQVKAKNYNSVKYTQGKSLISPVEYQDLRQQQQLSSTEDKVILQKQLQRKENIASHQSQMVQDISKDELYSHPMNEYLNENNGMNSGMASKRPRKRGPLIAQNHMFPPLDRSTKNQSETRLLKLPDIKGTSRQSNQVDEVGSYSIHPVNSIQYNHNTINQNNPQTYNYYTQTEEKKEQVRSRLEMLYKVKIPKQKYQHQIAQQAQLQQQQQLQQSSNSQIGSSQGRKNNHHNNSNWENGTSQNSQNTSITLSKQPGNIQTNQNLPLRNNILKRAQQNNSGIGAGIKNIGNSQGNSIIYSNGSLTPGSLVVENSGLPAQRPGWWG
eukprot:403339782